MKTSLITILWACCLLLFAYSCNKTVTEHQGNNHPVPVDRGEAVGAVISKMIGPEGGFLQSMDGAIRIDIPVGAVSATTTFTLQPVSKTLAAATGTAYRLGPENINFQKDIKITMRYTSEDLVGTNENDLYMAYQDEEGYWHRAIQTNIDKVNRSLEVKTRHFSDWVVDRMFYIKADKSSVSAREEVKLIAYYSDVTGEDDLLSPLIIIPDKNMEEWFVNGPGIISNRKNATAIYTAPEVITEPQTVAVGARIKNMVSQRYPDRPGNSGLVIVQVPVELTPDEYFIWEFNGSSHAGLSLDAALLGTTSVLAGTGLTGSVNITLNATKPGSYDMGSSVTPDNFGLQVFLSGQLQVLYQGMYYVCNEPTPRYGKGKLTITRFGTIGGIIEGDLSATVYTLSSGCNYTSRQITGKFRLRRRA